MRNTLLLATALATALAGGCCCMGSGVSGGELTVPADESSAAFLDRVAAQPNVSENDAMHGVLLLLDGQDEAADFAARVDALAGRGIVDAGWGHDATRAICKGKLAYMICRAMEVRGGLVLTVTGPSPRYCLRELQYMGIMAQGGCCMNVTGMEYVAVMSRADTYRATGEVPAEAKGITGIK